SSRASRSCVLPELPRSGLDRLAATDIGRAAAEVSTHRLFDVGAGWFRHRLEQRDSAHDLAALAIPALHDVVFDPSVLPGAPDGIPGHGFDGEDRTSGDEGDWHGAGARGDAVEMHRAGAAGGDSAAVLGTRHLQLFAQDPERVA